MRLALIFIILSLIIFIVGSSDGTIFYLRSYQLLDHNYQQVALYYEQEIDGV